MAVGDRQMPQSYWLETGSGSVLRRNRNQINTTARDSVVDGEVSNWKSVLSVVPQGSILGPLLFLIMIYKNLDDNKTSNILKLADDTKMFRKVNPDGDKQHL